MKNVFTLLCLLFLSLTAQATVITLNNNNPTPGQYTTFAAAYIAASVGDTILVHGSATSYGNIEIFKKLTVIGPGHKPNTPSGLGAKFGVVFIAENLTGVRIYGIEFSIIRRSFSAPWGLQNVDSLIIENVLITGSSSVGIYVGNSCNHLIIRNSVIQGRISFDLDNGGSPSDVDGVILENNYFSINNPLDTWGGAGNKVVSNNIFSWSGAGTLVRFNIRNTFLENNIFYGITPNSGTQTDCIYANNITYLTSNDNLPPAGQAGSNNLPGVNPLFVNPFVPPASSAFDYTRDYRLQLGSPAIGAGTNGTDIGMYEPTFTFSKTGEPARPQATVVMPNPVAVPVNGTTNVNFTIRKSTTETN